MYSYTECGYVERAIGCAKAALAYDDVNLQRTHTQVLPSFTPTLHVIADVRISRESDGHLGAFTLVPPAHTSTYFVHNGSR